MDGRTESQTDAEWRHLNLICNVICKISAQYLKACRRKLRKTAHFLHSKFTKKHNSFENWRKVTHSNLIYNTLKQSHVQNFSSICQSISEKKCGKLHISFILSSKRGITPSNIDTKRRHSYLICSRSKQINVQNFSSICQNI